MLYLSYWLKHPIILDFYPIIIRFSTLAQEQIGWRRVSTSRAGEITCSDNNLNFSYSCSQEECKDAPFT